MANTQFFIEPLKTEVRPYQGVKAGYEGGAQLKLRATIHLREGDAPQVHTQPFETMSHKAPDETVESIERRIFKDLRDSMRMRGMVELPAKPQPGKKNSGLIFVLEPLPPETAWVKNPHYYDSMLGLGVTPRAIIHFQRKAGSGRTTVRTESWVGSQAVVPGGAQRGIDDAVRTQVDQLRTKLRSQGCMELNTLPGR